MGNSSIISQNAKKKKKKSWCLAMWFSTFCTRLRSLTPKLTSGRRASTLISCPLTSPSAPWHTHAHLLYLRGAEVVRQVQTDQYFRKRQGCWDMLKCWVDMSCDWQLTKSGGYLLVSRSRAPTCSQHSGKMLSYPRH